MPVCSITDCGVNQFTRPNRILLFTIPKNLERKQKWLEALKPHIRKSFGKSIYVCELHFREEDIERVFETRLKDGSIHRIKREKCRLKATSVPCIFDKSKVDIVPEKENIQSVVEVDVDMEMEAPSPSRLDVALETYDLQTLKNDFRTLGYDLPDGWGFSEIPHAVFLFYYKDKCTPIGRTILINKDMTSEIRANGNLVDLELLRTVRNFNEVLTAMMEISKLSLCNGNSNNNSHFANPGISLPIVRGQCELCRIERKQEMERVNHQVKRTFLKIQKMQSKIDKLKEKNQRLQKKCK